MQKRSEKEQVIAELHQKLERATLAIVARPGAIDVATVTELRRKFRAEKVEYRVVKNTLARRAAQGTPSEPIAELLDGPTALILGYEAPIAPAKVLQEFVSQKAARMSVRGAVLDGRLIDAKAVEALSKLPGLPGLRSMLLGMLQRPAQLLVSVLAQPGMTLSI